MIVVPLAVAVTVFAPAPVEVNVLVATPLPLVVAFDGVNVLPEPVAEKTTFAPLTALLLPSFTVAVIVDEPLPAVNDAGAAPTVELLAEMPPPPPPDEWHAVEPESVNVLPATGTNFHA